MSVYREIDKLLPDYPVIMRVRAVGDVGQVLLQANGRGVDIPAKSNGIPLTAGDEVVVLQLGQGQLPTVLGHSPWSLCNNANVASTNDGASWTAADIIGLDAAIEGNANVVNNLANAHARVHTLLSASDHDVTGSASEGDLLWYDAGAANWYPEEITMKLNGGSY